MVKKSFNILKKVEEERVKLDPNLSEEIYAVVGKRFPIEWCGEYMEYDSSLLSMEEQAALDAFLASL